MIVAAASSGNVDLIYAIVAWSEKDFVPDFARLAFEVLFRLSPHDSHHEV